MGKLKSFALLALLFSLSLTVFAETSNDATHAKDEVKPSTEATEAIEQQKRDRQPQIAEAEVEANDAVVEPQQAWGRGGCRYGCCGGWWNGRCRYCCSRPQAVETEAVEANVVEPQQGGGGGGGGGRGGCRYGCCGGWWRGRCRYCCRSQAEANEVVETVEAQQGVVETEAVEANVVEPQQGGRGGGGGGGRGGCRYGCCGGWWRGRCRYCCRSQAEAKEVVETVEPQQGWGGGCRYGCCGGWWRGQCSYCCSRPQAEADVVEPQQRRGCRYGCCGSYAYGQCSACCSKKVATKEDNKEEEAKP